MLENWKGAAAPNFLVFLLKNLNIKKQFSLFAGNKISEFFERRCGEVYWN